MAKYGLLILVLFCGTQAHAATHAITPTGAGDKSGSDWANACEGFTGNCATTGTTGMVRGDIYYIAQGQYTPVGGWNQLFDVPDSGALRIEIRGAMPGDHGPANGWNTAFAVSTSPARIVPNLPFANSLTGNNTTIWRIRSSNWVINGNNCATNQVREFGQGILIDDSQSVPGLASIQSAILIDPYEIVNVTLYCVEIKGYGLSSSTGAAVAPTSINCCNGAV